MAAGLLAGGLPTANAFAADLGGNCCADLQERVAELEATTVRKGNRKFSLPITSPYRDAIHGGLRTEHVGAPIRPESSGQVPIAAAERLAGMNVGREPLRFRTLRSRAGQFRLKQSEPH